MSLEPTATHLPTFEQLFKYNDIKTVLEFGCGLYSTKFFKDMGCSLTSIEMQHEAWRDRVLGLLPDADIRLALGAMEWQKLPLKDRYDLIFVDGHADSRPECLMWAKDHTDLIVAHDTEHNYYMWDRADMSGFDKTVHDELSPWTTVWRRK